jgi:hypothetical protein
VAATTVAYDASVMSLRDVISDLLGVL